MRGRLLSLLPAIVFVFAQAGSASAASATISPHSQSHAFGVASSWSLSWGNATPFDVNFYYGDGIVYVSSGTSSRSTTRTHTYWPCPGEPTSYSQWLRVWDTYNAYADDNSTAHENSGSPC